ncbi:hypothetical protein WG66_003823, partial [Moniliophthora roreri]
YVSEQDFEIETLLSIAELEESTSRFLTRLDEYGEEGWIHGLYLEGLGSNGRERIVFEGAKDRKSDISNMRLFLEALRG